MSNHAISTGKTIASIRYESKILFSPCQRKPEMEIITTERISPSNSNLIFLFMGVKGDTVAGVFGQNQFVIWIVILVASGIFGFAMMQVYGDSIQNITNPDDDTGLNGQIGQILFHPKSLISNL